MHQNFQKTFLEEVRLLVEPIVAAEQSDLSRRLLFEGIGWDLEAISGLPIDALAAVLTQFVESSRRLEHLIENPPETIPGFVEALDTVSQLFSAIRQFQTVMDTAGVVAPPQFAELSKDLIESLIIQHLQFWHPVLYDLAVLLTIIQPAEDLPLSEPVLDGNVVVRFPHRRPRLRMERLAQLLTNPIDVLRAEYFETDSLVTSAEAKRRADRIFPRLGRLFAALNLRTVYSIKPQYGLDFGALGNELGSGMLTVFLDPDLEDFSFGVTLALSPAERGDLGLVIVPFGTFNFSRTFGSWALISQLTADVEAFAIGPHGLTIVTQADALIPRIEAQLTTIRLPEADEGNVLLIGSATGTRLEVGQFYIVGEARLSADVLDYGLLFGVGSAALVITPDDGDGFLREALPPNGLRTIFDLALGWSSRQGFYFRGSAGLEAQLPVHTSIAGRLSVDRVALAIQTKFQDIRTAVAATASLKLGPITAMVEAIGLEANFTFPEDGGNLGPVDLALSFKPPDGVGLLIDAGSVVGSGFLFFDPVEAQYAGAVQLEFNTITLQGVGLITSRLPGGASGFSMLIIITAEGFTPIQLGFGFTLNGVGGLLAVNRTASVEPLRQGLKQRALDAVLFPKDPVRNAPQIISNLSQLFPVKRDQFAFGPLAIIGWGTPTVLTIELALVLEFPSPFRLIALGQFRALLPSQDRPLVRLNMDALGVVDFDRGELAIDATLYDSRILRFNVSGDMALRVRWTDDPAFLLAVGGFHPRFQPPPGFPALERIAVSLTKGNNPRLRLTAYLALTSNTAQIGAHLDLFVAAGGASIEGALSFDALFQFAPFQFIVDLGAGVTLKWRGRTLLGVYLEMTLSGPAPWHARGKAKIKVWIFSVSVRFDKTFGDAAPATLPPVDPLPELLRALGDRRNWGAQLPTAGAMLVTLRELPASDEVLVHPLGRLSVRQRVLPLNVEISRFGNTTPSGDRRFTITQVAIHERPVEQQRPTRDFFARAQFVEMGDAQKLTSPSFERMESGVELGVATVAFGGQTDGTLMVTTEIEYEECILGDEGCIQTTQPYDVTPEALAAVASMSAAGRAQTRHTGRDKYRAPALQVAFAAVSYVVARTADLATVAIPELDGAAQGATYTAVHDALAQHLVLHPEARDQLQIVPHNEATGAPA